MGFGKNKNRKSRHNDFDAFDNPVSDQSPSPMAAESFESAAKGYEDSQDWSAAARCYEKSGDHHMAAACPHSTESRACNASPCPVDCAVAPWGSWSTCTFTCGGGVQQRVRARALFFTLASL